MELQTQINKDFMTAFKEKDMDKKNFLGVIKGEIQTAQGKGIEPTDENVLSIIKKMEKSLKQTNTEDSKRELTYIEGYLPQLMSEDQIRDIVEGYIQGGAGNIGQIMGYFNKTHKGQADNKLVSQIARELLQ